MKTSRSLMLPSGLAPEGRLKVFPGPRVSPLIHLLVFLLVPLSGAGNPTGLPMADPFMEANAGSAPYPGAMAGSLPERIAEEVILALYHFDFSRAERLSSGLMRDHPGRYISHISRVYYYWWMMISWPRPAEIEKMYKESILRALPLAREAMADNATHRDTFFYINLYAMLARIDLQQGAWVQGMRTLSRCAVQVEHTMGKEGDFEGFYLTSGLYNFITVQAVSQYPFLRLYSLFYPEGNRELGLTQLKMAFQSDSPIWKTEAGYFLMRIFLEQEKDALSARPYADWLITAYPTNLIFQYYHLQVLLALGDQTAAQGKAAEIRRLAETNGQISPEQRSYFLGLMEDHGPGR
ncbi:MAG: hypothetical protein R6U86_05480 [Bacteroidales bacterium]